MAANLKPIDQQVIVITGASSGIGLATAKAAARQGAKVVLAARSENTLREIAEGINRAGGQAIAVACDVADRRQVDRLAEQAIAQFGRVDTWVNDAGLGMHGRLDECDEDDARKLFDINFWGVVHGSLVALEHMRADGGAIINVGSEVSEASAPLLGFYTASKHAVKGFTDTLRIEIEEVDQAPLAITLIQPTAVNTPFPEHSRNFMAEEPKLPDPTIDPDDVAEAILSAAQKQTREAKVGTMASIHTAAAKFLPGLAKKAAAGQAEQQQYAEPPRNPGGALYKPSEQSQTAGRIHGVGGVPKRG